MSGDDVIAGEAQYVRQKKNVQQMFDSISGRYDLANTILSFGIHHYWRHVLFGLDREALHGRALDVCTGTGDLLRPLAKKCDEVVGIDLSYGMLQSGAQRRGGELGKKFLGLVQGDALKPPFREKSFDVIAVSFGVRNFENLREGLSALRSLLTDNGRLFILEFGSPQKGVWSALYTTYSRYILPTVGGLVTGDRAAYSYLNETSLSFPYGESFHREAEESGLRVTASRMLTGGIAYGYCCSRAAE